MENSTKTSVLYNANCPVCNFEIGHYASYADKAGLPIRFDDLNTDARDQWGLDADTAAHRLYVLHDGVNQTGFTGGHKAWKISHDQRKFRKPFFDRSAGARSAFGA